MTAFWKGLVPWLVQSPIFKWHGQFMVPSRIYKSKPLKDETNLSKGFGYFSGFGDLCMYIIYIYPWLSNMYQYVIYVVWSAIYCGRNLLVEGKVTPWTPHPHGWRMPLHHRLRHRCLPWPQKKQFGGRFRPLFTVNIEDKMELFGEMTQWKESKMYQQKMQKVLRTGQKWMNCLGRRLTLWFYRMVICKRVTNYMRTMV